MFEIRFQSGDPEHGVIVSQAALALLEIGFHLVGGFTEFVMPVVLFLELGLEELAAVPDAGGADLLLHGLEKCLGARQEAGLHEVGNDGDVPRRLVDAVLQGPYAVPDVQTDIPEQSEEARELLLLGARRFRAKQEQQIDIGTRVQLAATISPESYQSALVAGGFPCGAVALTKGVVQEPKHGIRQLGRGAHDLSPAGPALMVRPNECTSLGNLLLQGSGDFLRGGRVVPDDGVNPLRSPRRCFLQRFRVCQLFG